jgi:hypothetical protein
MDPTHGNHSASHHLVEYKNPRLRKTDFEQAISPITLPIYLKPILQCLPC